MFTKQTPPINTALGVAFLRCLQLMILIVSKSIEGAFCIGEREGILGFERFEIEEEILEQPTILKVAAEICASSVSIVRIEQH